MATGKAWIGAFRLRTLPLAFSCILMGAFLAKEAGSFSWGVFLLSLSTTLFLQVLSNLANDYGDAQHGVDDETRIGPARAIQSGAISTAEMKKGMLVCAILAFASGIALLKVSGIGSTAFMIFLTLGLASIFAALKYTTGKNPYGYKAMGDFFVFLFFGILGVLGSYYLHGLDVPSSTHVFPASAIGFLSAGVLNLNNMRDSVPDKAAGKITMAGILGYRTAKVYQAILISSGLLCLIIYMLYIDARPVQYLFLAPAVIFLVHILTVFKCENPVDLDPELKKVALSTFLISILFGACLTLL